MATIRAKFLCQTVRDNLGTNQIVLNAVVDGSEENKEFFKLTPGGIIDMYSVNPEVEFQEGKEYFVDFSLAEAESDDLPVNDAIEEVADVPSNTEPTTDALPAEPVTDEAAAETQEEVVSQEPITEEILPTE